MTDDDLQARIRECQRRYSEYTIRQLSRTFWIIHPEKHEDFRKRKEWLDVRRLYLEEEYKRHANAT